MILIAACIAALVVLVLGFAFTLKALVYIGIIALAIGACVAVANAGRR